jgi:PPOX class probable F420-dependent enzyme
MPDRSTATDRRYREEAADDGSFAPLAQGRYLLVTTSRPRGAPVSARVQGIVEGHRAYFGAGRRSGTVKRLRLDGSVQVTACDALGMVSYGQPRYAAIRFLTGEEASHVAARLARRYPVRRRFLRRLLHRTQVHYQLLVP